MTKEIGVAAKPRRVARLGVLGSGVLLAFISSVAASAAVTPSWNGYHWSRTGPLVIQLGNNVSSVWQPYLAAASSQWSAANNIDFTLTTGATTASSCRAVYGSVQACSWNYGATGWLGYANVWTSNGFIVQATVKLNDYYFKSAKYNTTAWRSMTACQEVGHTLGLGHSNTIRTNLNLGTCMDYSNDPSGKVGGATGFLANTTPYSGDFAALDGIYAKLDATQLAYTKPQYLTGEGFSIGDDDVDHEPSAVPEPTTWALLLMGFGAVGRAMRRRAAPRAVAA